MKLPKLYQRLFRSPEPGVDGAGTPPAAPAAPAAEPVASPAAEPVAAPAAPVAAPGPVAAPAAAAAPAAPEDRMGGLRALMDKVGRDPAAEPTPGPLRDGQGRFASATPAAPQAPAAPVASAATPAAPVATPPAPVQPGELDLTPPEGMSERAQARWTQLTERVKGIPQLEHRAQEASTALDSVRQLVTQAGLAPQEFTELLDVARASRSSNPQDMQRALQYLDTARTDLALRLGVDVQPPDPLTAHADLQQKVQSMLMTREDALEIARLRTVGQRAQQATQQQTEHEQFRQSITQASTTMATALQQRAAEPGHAVKVQAIQQHFANPQNLQRFVTTYQPQQWVAALMWMYDHTQVPQAAPPPPAAPAAPAVPQPLRPGFARTGAAQTAGPVTAASALENAFAQIGM